jgi:hypothetical protein
MTAMDDKPTTEPTGGDPGPRQPTRLDRPPSERYGSEASIAEAGRQRRTIQAIGVALAGAVAITVLGGPLSMTAGLLAVAVVVGVVLGAMLRPATAVAVSLAVGSVAVGLLGVWLFARVEGGVLDPLAYFGEVQGPLAPVQLLLAAVAAIVGSR